MGNHWDYWGLNHKLIQVKNMAGFSEFQQKLTGSKATTALPASAAELGKAVGAYVGTKTTKDGVAFNELDFFRNRVRVQSGDLGKFAGEAASGLTGFGETALKVLTEYRTADAVSSKVLQAPKDFREADHDAAKGMSGTASGLPYDARGWDLKRSATDDTDYYSIPPTDEVTPTQWSREGDKPGDVFQRVYTILKAESPDYLDLIAKLWHHIRDLLIVASDDLRTGTEKHLAGWTGSASRTFHARALESMRSINTWHISALHRAEEISQAAFELAGAQNVMDFLHPIFLKIKALPETVPLETTTAEGEPITVPWIQVNNLERDKLLLEADTRAVKLAVMLAGSLVQTANWQAPTMYPGFLATGAKYEQPFVDPRKDGRIGPTGVPTNTGVKTGGVDPRKQYEAAIKQLQQQNQDLRDAYDKEIKKLQKQAQAQIDALQKQMQDQQKQAQDAVQQTQQQAQDQLDKAQEAVEQSQQDAQKQIEALQKQLQDAASAAAAAGVQGLGSIPSVIGSLGSLGSLGSVGGGGSGAFGSVGTGSALSTAGAVDMLGRGGVNGTATTGLGASALSGRSAAANPGGMPFMPPMGGGAPATGGGGSLAGRKGRPALPDEKKKPQAKPRIVDPDGDGTTEVRPSGGARAHTRSTDDRAATVARTRKAPETESGQALGRTA